MYINICSANKTISRGAYKTCLSWYRACMWPDGIPPGPLNANDLYYLWPPLGERGPFFCFCIIWESLDLTVVPLGQKILWSWDLAGVSSKEHGFTTMKRIALLHTRPEKKSISQRLGDILGCWAASMSRGSHYTSTAQKESCCQRSANTRHSKRVFPFSYVGPRRAPDLAQFSLVQDIRHRCIYTCQQWH